MPQLPTGLCATCATENVKLRPNPFTQSEQCEDCRNAEIIGVTDIKKQYGLKDADLDNLQLVTEPKPAFLGGPDRRWYLIREVEIRNQEVMAAREVAKQAKQDAKQAKEAAKEAKEAAKEAEKEQQKTDAPPAPGDDPPKRGRGRPRKGEVVVKASKVKPALAAPATVEAAPLKRKRATKAGDDDEAEDKDGDKGTDKDGGTTDAAAKTQSKSGVPAKGIAKPPADAADGAPVVKRGRGRPRKHVAT